MLPTFIVIGAAKAGTTTMCDLLAAHPEIFVTDPKEPHWFSRLTSFEARRDWYESLFEGALDATARGEGSTSYSHPHRIYFTAPRLRAHVPQARLIYMVRHPIRRLESDWRMRRLEGRLTQPIAEALERNVSLVTMGLYWEHLSTYRALFPDEQILVVFLEDLAREPEEEMRRVYRHVGVDPDFLPPASDRARNTARDRARSAAAQAFADRLPGVRRFASLLPEEVVEMGKRVLTSPDRYEAEIEWPQGQLERVGALFRDDSRRLLEYCGKGVEFWDL